MKEENIKKYVDDISLINDRDYVSNNVGWNIGGNDPATEITNGKVNEWYYFDNETQKIIKFEFDKVIVYSSHGFGGTTFDMVYYLNNNLTMSFKTARPTKEELKDYLINEHENHIVFLEERIKDEILLIEQINKL